MHVTGDRASEVTLVTGGDDQALGVLMLRVLAAPASWEVSVQALHMLPNAHMSALRVSSWTGLACTDGWQACVLRSH